MFLVMLFYGAKLQILNDIHNSRRCFQAGDLLFYGAKLQILNDIHNRITITVLYLHAVLWCKVTNFE